MKSRATDAISRIKSVATISDTFGETARVYDGGGEASTTFTFLSVIVVLQI